MSDTELINAIIKTLCKSGWGGTKRHNLMLQVNRVVDEYKEQNEKLNVIRKEVLK